MYTVVTHFRRHASQNRRHVTQFCDLDVHIRGIRMSNRIPSIVLQLPQY